jgi:hypothetical protein
MRRSFAALVVLCLLAVWLPARAEEDGLVRSGVEPTCTEEGYLLLTDPAAGTTQVQHLPALGHAFSEWVTDEAAALQRRACSRCGLEETLRISTIPEENMPKLYLTGSLEGVGKKQRVLLEAAFESPEQRFESYVSLTMQGHSTFGLPKRNYTIRFYKDAEESRKRKLQFRNWQEEYKYILKANYHDRTQCRNLVGAQVWREITASRRELSPHIAALPLLGAVDGFPVEVYLNGDFFGLYTMNLHKDDDLYGLAEGHETALVICNRQTGPESLFRAKAAFDEDGLGDWEIEYCGTLEEAWAKESFNALIDFLMTADDDSFRASLAQRLDVDAAIDYLILIYALGLQHSGAKDLVMLNYGDVWIPSAFDMDEAFGLDTVNGAVLAPDAFLPGPGGSGWDSATGSLLWDRLLTCFHEEIQARYLTLRKGVLTEENLLRLVKEFIGSIPESSYDRDRNRFPDHPFADVDMNTQIAAYISQRLPLLDTALEVEPE